MFCSLLWQLLNSLKVAILGNLVKMPILAIYKADSYGNFQAVSNFDNFFNLPILANNKVTEIGNK